MNTKKIRQLFLAFYKANDHVVVPSSSLVPKDDPSLLFTSAGMVQFKKIFLGQETLNYSRVTSCQKCLRAGGKHNDLENVGFTSRHHTFFEMLGNFSFGDYFKQEACFYAWEFLTKHLNIDPQKLWVTVYKDDQEAESIWLNKVKIDPTRISKCDEAENFWAMGETGPCGPCTEIYYDYGPEYAGSPPGLGDCGERYVEIYNLVFMQYNRTSEGSLHKLPKPCVDTGMGLERIAAVMQGVHSNYEIDIFAELIKDLAELLDLRDLAHPSLRVIADHLRACAFLVIDGIYPTNEGRGYVLRRIMRRAIRHGYKLGRNQPFFNLLVKSLARVMGDDFPELKEYRSKIEKVFLTEELQFSKTLEHGMSLLQQEIKMAINNLINGDVIFKLYDTYGFPVDLIADVAKEHSMTLDLTGFEYAMSQQKVRARQLNKFHDLNLELENLTKTKFVGYEKDQINSQILQIFDYDSNQELQKLDLNKKAKIILDITPFYAQSGGQVGDQGCLIGSNGAKFIVEDTQKLGNTYIHIGKLEVGNLAVKDLISAEIDVVRRQTIRLNHSATHLLHSALRQVLGNHVKQKGSIVDDQRLRFDFEHFQPLTIEQIIAVEQLVNDKIRANKATTTTVMPIEEAIKIGAIALFDEKYQDQVRVLNIADNFSVELCGGTHVVRSGDIGCFKIITEESIASGTRRITAITGEHVLKYISDSQIVLQDLLKLLKVSDFNLINENLNKLLTKNKELEKNLELSEKKYITLQIDSLKQKTEITEQGEKILVTKVDIHPKYLKFAIDRLKEYLGIGIIILGSEYNDKAFIVVGVTKILTDKISALEIANHMADFIGGKGWGRIDLAEVSGSNLKSLSKDLQTTLAIGHKKIIEILVS